MKSIGNFFNSMKRIGSINFKWMGMVNSQKKGTLTYAENIKYFEDAINNDNISVIITTPELYKKFELMTLLPEKGFFLVDNPKCTFWKLYNQWASQEPLFDLFTVKRGNHIDIHPTAYIEEKVSIGNNVVIGAGTVVLNGTIIEDDTVIDQNCTIGSEGLQAIYCGQRNLFVKHIGGVKIGKRVRILSNTNISKAVDNSYTTVDDDTIISLHCSIGHNSLIGKNCRLAGNVLVGGSAIIGDNVWIGPSSTIKDGITIDNNAQVKIGSVVVKNVKKNEEVSGNFAYSHKKRIRNFVKETK